MLYMLDRRVGGLEPRKLIGPVAKMFAAMIAMVIACVAVTKLSMYPAGRSRVDSLIQLIVLMAVGATVYCGCCAAMGVEILDHVLPKRLRSRVRTSIRSSQNAHDQRQ
jgi:hypothetical protein